MLIMKNILPAKSDDEVSWWTEALYLVNLNAGTDRGSIRLKTMPPLPRVPPCVEEHGVILECDTAFP